MKVEWTNSDSLTTTQTTKAVFVFNMPSSCKDCRVTCTGYTPKEYFQSGYGRPEWCPLRPFLLGEELRKFRGTIKDKNTLIGFNMAIAICNKYLGETE